MWCWGSNEGAFLWGWWWLIPLACVILCIWSCRASHRRADGTARFCGWRGPRRPDAGGWRFCGWKTPYRADGDLEALRGEIRELREELGKMKGKQGG